MTQHANKPIQVDSLIESNKDNGQMVKVRNFQALIDNAYHHRATANETATASLNMTAIKDVPIKAVGPIPSLLAFNDE